MVKPEADVKITKAIMGMNVFIHLYAYRKSTCLHIYINFKHTFTHAYVTQRPDTLFFKSKFIRAFLQIICDYMELAKR